MFCPWIVILVLFDTVVGVPPDWITPQKSDSFSVDVNNANSCNSVTTLDASAPTAYYFSISSNFANGEFVVGVDENYNDVLKCDVSKLSEASYTVTLRAFLDLDNTEYSEINITVTVDNLVTNSAPVFHNLPATISLLRNKYSLDGEYVLMDVNVTDADGDSVTITLSECVSEMISGLSVVSARTESGHTFSTSDIFSPPVSPVIAYHNPTYGYLANDLSEERRITYLGMDVSSSVTQVTVEYLTTVNGVLTITKTEVGLADNGYVFVNVPAGEPSEEVRIYFVSTTDLFYVGNVVVYACTGIEMTRFAVSGTQIKVVATLEDLTSPFELVVTAADNGTPVESSTSALTLNLGYAPQFTDPADSNDTIYVCETLVGTDEVMTLSATDQDTDNSTLVFSMDNSPEITKSKFVINGTVLQVADGVSFDYEEDEAVLEYSISLEVSDGTFSSTLNTTLVLEDFNDNAPTFEPIVSSVYTGENTAAGTSVFLITATDRDKTDPNNNLTYFLSGSSDWSIDSKTGEITVSAGVTLNFTKQSIYELTVVATDGGDPQENATATVSIHILTAPKFDNLATTTTVTVDENVDVGTSVFELTVSDQDNTTMLTVSITSQSVSSGFKLDGKTVKTNASLDKETLDSYNITFKVSDGIYETQSAVLTITVNDLNDMSPVIRKPIHDITVPETASVGYVIVTITATDADSTSPNNLLTYSIQSGNDKQYFAMNSGNGSVTLDKAPINIGQDTYPLKGIVVDGGTPALNDTVQFNIVISSTTVDECASSPCKNAATCSSFINVYYCSCATGWTGIQCESNIDDCKPESCLNNGTCIDGVNSVTCNCSSGWSGDTCTDACTDNKWGRNCVENCNCPNASRLMANVGNQQCDIKSGACKCNEQWTGTKCEKDFDECQNQTICAGIANTVCENTVGDYFCACKVGYSGPFDNCTEQTDDGPVLKAGEKVVLVNTSLQTDCPSDLDKPSVYNPIKENLRIMMNEQTKRNCTITKIWCGTLEFEAVIVVNDTADVAVRLQEIRDGKTLNFGNQTVTASNITVNNNLLKPTNNQTGDFAQKVCEVYTSISPCAADHQCVSESGRPTCKYIEPDNLALILGLGLGLLLPLLLVLIIVILVWYCNRNRRSAKSRSRSSSNRSVESRPWQERFFDNSWQGKLPRQEIKDYSFVRDNYALPTNRDYYGMSSL